MKKNLLIIGLVLAVFGLAGCIAISSNKQECPKSSTPESSKVSQAKPKVADPTFAEIDMIKVLFSESAKGDAYEAIAARPRLSPAARTHLIEAVHNDTFAQTDKERVLLTLLRNSPSPAQQTMRKPRSEPKK